MAAKTFTDMIRVLPPSTVGAASIVHHTVTKLESTMSAFHPGQFCPEGTYAVLKVNGQVWMSDTRMERISNYAVLHEARGDVFIAGLGIGMILLPLLRKPEVKSVTVMEINRDVIQLVEPHIRKAARRSARKLKIYEGDALILMPDEGHRFDTVSFDIWPDTCGDYWEQIKMLRRWYRKRLRPGAWMGAWKQDEIRDAARAS